MKNHDRVVALPAEPKTLVLLPEARQKRLLQHRHAYSKMFWNQGLKEVLQEGYKTYVASIQPPEKPKPEFAWRNEQLQEMYEGETEDTKRKIEAFRIEQKGRVIDESTRDESIPVEETDLQRALRLQA